MGVFSTKTKSEYILFVKCKGFLNNPDQNIQINVYDQEGQGERIESAVLQHHPLNEDADKTSYVYLPISILLEDQRKVFCWKSWAYIKQIPTK